MSEPAKLFEKMVLERRLIHNHNPLLRVQVAGTKVLMDPAENIKPDKANSTSRIDAVVGTIMALGRAALYADDETYADTGVMVIDW